VQLLNQSLATDRNSILSASNISNISQITTILGMVFQLIGPIEVNLASGPKKCSSIAALEVVNVIHSFHHR